nr:methyltransferase domain-containing protein [Demequina sediminicola]
MQCAYWDAQVCRSCSLIETPHGVQLADKVTQAHSALDPLAPHATWHEPCASALGGFRNKAKMVVGGTVEDPTLGILDAAGRGVDLRACGLYPAVITDALPVLADFIRRVGWQPYDVPTRRGELKYLLVTASARNELMVRCVARSTEAESRVRKHLPWLRECLPSLAVATLNVLPEHKAVTEGDREMVLTDQDSLTMPMGEVDLHVGPRAFFQTNTAVATELYAQVSRWIDASGATSLWDLYCGVGGFALTCAAPGRVVTGIEVSPPAIDAARKSRDEAQSRGVDGMDSVHFEAADAVAWASGQQVSADAVVVNPPRRGLGESLSTWLNGSGAHTVVYSSCHLPTLAADLQRMPAYEVRDVRVFDMFPHTGHMEVAALLARL